MNNLFIHLKRMWHSTFERRYKDNFNYITGASCEIKYFSETYNVGDFQNLKEVQACFMAYLDEKISGLTREKEKNETFNVTKNIAKLKSLQRLINKAAEKEESKVKNALKILLNNHKISVFDTIVEESVWFFTLKSLVFSFLEKFDLRSEEVNRLLFGGIEDKEEERAEYWYHVFGRSKDYLYIHHDFVVPVCLKCHCSEKGRIS